MASSNPTRVEAPIMVKHQAGFHVNAVTNLVPVTVVKSLPEKGWNVGETLGIPPGEVKLLTEKGYVVLHQLAQTGALSSEDAANLEAEREAAAKVASDEAAARAAANAPASSGPPARGKANVQAAA